MKRKTRISITMLLCLTMVCSTLFSSAAVFAESGNDTDPGQKVSTEIKDYLYNSEILTQDGKPYDPADKLNSESSFSVKLMFSEINQGDNARQFPEDGKMTYQIPDIITGFDAIDNLPIKDTGTSKTIGTYSISTSGLISIDMDDDYVKEFSNIKAFLTFEGSFSADKIQGEEQVTISFSDSVSIIVKLEDAATLTVSKQASTYDYNTGLINYTVAVTTDYAASNVVIADPMDEKLTLNGNITVKNKAGANVAFNRVDSGNDSWKINVGNMAKGEKYTITYQAKLSDKFFDAMKGSSNGEYSATIPNTVTAKADNSEEVSAKAEVKVKFSRVKKSCKVQGNNLVWTVTVNDTKYLDLSGYKVTDTLLTAGIKLDKSSKIQMLKDGAEVGDGDVPDWGDISNSDTEWSYTFPENTGKHSFTFTYKTNLPENANVGQSGTNVTYKNKVALTKGSDENYKGEGSYNAPGPRFWKHKYGTSYSGGKTIVTDAKGNTYLRWTNVITVPSTGLQKLVFTDSIEKAYKSHQFEENPIVKKGVPTENDNFNVINVDGYNGDVALRQTADQSGFSLYFGTTETDQAKSSLPATGSQYTVKITCYTKVTGTDSGVRRNSGGIKVDSKTDTDYEDISIDPQMGGSKSGKFDSETGTILWTVKVNTNYAKMNENDVVIKDTFSDNQTFDPDYGVYLGSTKLNSDKIKKVTDTSYNFNIGKLKNNATYTVKYRTKVKAGVLSTAGKKTFDNTAIATVNDVEQIKLSAKCEVSNNFLTKQVAQKPTLNNQYKVGFKLTVNPNKALLNSTSADNPSDYKIEDVYNKSLDLDLGSFVIKRDGTVLDSSKNEYQIKHEEGKENNTITIQIPKADGHSYTIEYKATVKGNIGETVTYTNKATLTVKDTIDNSSTEDRVVIKQQSSSAGASGSKQVIYVQKRDSANTNKVLDDAVFALYKDSVADGNLLGSQKTANGGKATFGEGSGGSNNLTLNGKAYYLKSGVKYILVETSAPADYEKDSTQKVFQLADEDGNATLKDVAIYNTGYTFNITNAKYNFYIQKTAAHTNQPLTGAEFSLYDNINCEGNALETVKGDNNGKFGFKNLMAGTYYMKETKVPTGYHDSGKIYKVEIDANGDAAIDGKSVGSDRTLTIANTLAGKIKVTKEVKEDGLGSQDYGKYYAAVFSDSQFKTRVSDVKALEMKGNQSTSVTFDNLKINETYYVSETDADGKALPNEGNEIDAVVSYEDQTVTLDPSHLTAETKITNSFYSQYYWSGSIDVTKIVTMGGDKTETNKVFYAGLYSDAALTQRVGDIKALEMKGNASATVTFADLAINTTYYVAETDKDGNVITNAKEQLGCEMTIDNNKIDLTKEHQEGSAKITNAFPDDYNFYIQKTSAHTGETLSGAEFTLYKDSSCTEVKATAKDDGNAKFAFKNLMEGNYFLKETKVPEGYYDSGKIYNVVIAKDGTATIDGNAVNAEDKTMTITNTLSGKIKVTKEVKEDGLGSEDYGTYYAAVFSDDQFKNRVSDVKALEMKGNQSTSVTFDNLKVNETYYVSETDAEGKALPNEENEIGAVVSYENQVITLDPNNLTAESKITNSFYSQYYWAGSINVTKKVTVGGKAEETNNIFYVGLYSDEACKERVGDIQPLVMNGKASTTVTFSDLPINKTYYVAETDSEGNVITDAKKQLNCEMTIDNNKFSLTKENTTGAATITNDFPEEEQFYYDGEITVNKTTTYKGEAYNVDDVYYVALFADKAHTKRLTDVKALDMNGTSKAKVSFGNLAYGAYYLAETDKKGNALTEMEAAELGYTNLLEEVIQLDEEPVAIDLENQITNEYVKEHNVQTGDNSNMTLAILGLLTAMTAMGVLVISRRRRG